MRYWLAAAVFAFSCTASAEDVTVRTYTLPTHGTFQLKVPASWKDSVAQPPNGLPPTITFSSSNGPPFQVLVTPIWPARADIKAPTAEDLRRGVSKVAHETESQAVEKQLVVKELKGAASGYYFSATDRAPEPGEYKLMNQGMVSAQDLRVVFTILTNDGQDAIVKAALGMLITAEHH